MKVKFYKISLGLAVSGLLLTASVYAQQESDLYVKSGSGEAVKDPFDDCVRAIGGESLTECGGGLPVVEPPPVTPTRETITLGTDAFFDFDKATLKPEGESRLAVLARDLQELGATNVNEIEVVGHTDSIGTEEYNQGLSERRAQAVVDFLVAEGVDSTIVSARGEGELVPVADNSTREGRAQNRRVEVNVEGTQDVERFQKRPAGRP